MSRLRRVLLLVALLLVTLLLAGLALADPFHLRHAGWFTVVLVALALLLATLTVSTLVGRGLLRGLLLVVGLTVLVTWVIGAWLAAGLAGTDRELQVVAGGERRLVVLESRGLSIDPLHSVVLRAGDGPFEQESTVYSGLAEGAVPSEVRFVDTDTVEVRAGACRYSSDVELWTLAVDPVHRPQSVSAC